MTITVRPATTAVAPAMKRLAAANPPLDVHTDYTYWVMCHVGAGLSFVAERDGMPVGFVTAVPGDASSNGALIWQVCVDDAARGAGVGRRLVESVRDAARGLGLTRLEFTIASDNTASRALFASVLGGPLIPRGTAGPEHHPEDLFVVEIG